MATLLQFSRNMKKRGAQVENGSARALRRGSRAALRELVYGTPVDKGTARSNWRVSIGAPTRTVISAYAPGSHLGIGESANANAAISAGYAVIDQMRPGRGYRVSRSLYIVNNVPYIYDLNNGWSTQQPEAFIDRAMEHARIAIVTVKIFDLGLESKF